MSKYIIDGRGKKMVLGGRRQVAQKARTVHRLYGSAQARRLIEVAAARYVRDGSKQGWSEGQTRHNRLVTRTEPMGLDGQSAPEV